VERSFKTTKNESAVLHPLCARENQITLVVYQGDIGFSKKRLTSLLWEVAGGRVSWFYCRWVGHRL
jgi:hypothetical protein